MLLLSEILLTTQSSAKLTVFFQNTFFIMSSGQEIVCIVGTKGQNWIYSMPCFIYVPWGTFQFYIILCWDNPFFPLPTNCALRSADLWKNSIFFCWTQYSCFTSYKVQDTCKKRNSRLMKLSGTVSLQKLHTFSFLTITGWWK